MDTTPQTLVRLGRYDSPLEEAVQRCGEQLTEVSIGLGNTIKYATFKTGEEPFLLMVSQQKERRPTPPGYNVVVTVTSYSSARNQQEADKFERETKITLDIPVPESLNKHYALRGIPFQALVRNPEAGMAALKEKR